MSIDLLAHNTLEQAYKQAFEYVRFYANAHYLSGEKCDEAMLNLYDVLYQAQSDQQPVEKIMGFDRDEFCHHYFSDYGLMDKVQTLSARLVNGVIGLLGTEWLFSNEANAFNIGRVIAAVILFLIWESIILIVGKRYMKREKQQAVMIILSFVGAVVMYSAAGWLNVTYMITSGQALFLIVAYAIALFVWEKYKPSRMRDAKHYVKQLVKQKRKERFNKDFSESFTKLLEKRFLKRKNKQLELTWKTFLSTQKIKVLREHRILMYSYLTILCIVSVCSILFMNESVIDKLLFIALNALLLLGITLFFQKGMQHQLIVINQLLGE